jgi:peptidyl-prolyl cis-trans isomerase B (cyclophilin B)
VLTAARKAFASLVSVRPADQSKRRRYPYQPSQAELASLPTEATIRLEQGSVILRLLPEIAPVTIARFAALANGGFYNDTTFHRVVPNFFVQGGSPDGNDYSGTSRFMRDEVGPQAWHVRGAVGMSSRGTDAGDGQIFVDLVDLPRFDRDYTVFAYVTKGIEFVDNLLDGARILNITVK